MFPQDFNPIKSQTQPEEKLFLSEGKSLMYSLYAFLCMCVSCSDSVSYSSSRSL